MKKIVLIIIALCFSISLLLAIGFCSITTFWSVASPSGEYKVLGWTSDIGGAGYLGKIYYKEVGIFNALRNTHISPPASVEWTSDTTFVVRNSSNSVTFTVNE